MDADEQDKDPTVEAEPGAVNVMTDAEQSVRFINSEVLDPPQTGELSFVKPYADQVAAMMLEDARSFMQGSEQVMVIALARSLELILKKDPAGAAGLAAVESLMQKVPQFGADVATTTGKILGEF